jgi:flagellar basal-body rod modification protein FlgD
MATTPSVSGISGSAASSLSMQDLLRVMLTELTFQNPLKPVDNKDFMTQVAQFSSLDASQQLNQNLERLLSLQSINQSVGLLGKTVSVTTNTGGATGQVTALTLVNGEPQLTLTTTGGGTVTGISIGQVETIR